MRRILLLAAAVTLATGLGCSEGIPGPESGGPDLAKGGGGGGTGKVNSVTVSPASAAVAVGATVQLVATAAPPKSAPTFAWSTSNAGVATVSTSGLVTGVAAGTATIGASAGGRTGSATVTVTAAPTPGEDPVLVGAGDIAVCGASGDEATALLLDAIPGTVFTLGDNAYENGSAADYANCYGPSWGRHKARTRPSAGNHEYHTQLASGYFQYFGAAAGDPEKGYYSYDLGGWHVVVLNSNSGCSTIGCDASSPQVQWLRADLAASAAPCTLAYWHHPRFNSGADHGNDPRVAALWTVLYEFHADVVLNGHEHLYERFAPQTPTGAADPAHGIRQFTVGTGGRAFYPIGTVQPNSEVRRNDTHGVLKLTLRPGAYDWQFVPVAGKAFTDAGTGSCHS